MELKVVYKVAWPNFWDRRKPGWESFCSPAGAKLSYRIGKKTKRKKGYGYLTAFKDVDSAISFVNSFGFASSLSILECTALVVSSDPLVDMAGKPAVWSPEIQHCGDTLEPGTVLCEWIVPKRVYSGIKFEVESGNRMNMRTFTKWAYSNGSWSERVQRALNEHSPLLAALIRLEQATHAITPKVIAAHIDEAAELCGGQWASHCVSQTTDALVSYAVWLRNTCLKILPKSAHRHPAELG